VDQRERGNRFFGIMTFFLSKFLLRTCKGKKRCFLSLIGYRSTRGELLKLEIRISKRTIQKYMKQIPRKQARGQMWKAFLRNHAAEVWACDFLQVMDLFFRSLFAFFIIELKSRKVIHVHMTGSPTSGWRNNCGRQLPMGANT
jgi:hypothetical protein